MRFFGFLFFASLCGILVPVAGLASHLSRVVERAIGARAAHAAAMWFESGTGWGGDDAALDAILSSRRLRGYVREEARAQREAGMVTGRVLFLDDVLGAVD